MGLASVLSGVGGLNIDDGITTFGAIIGPTGMVEVAVAGGGGAGTAGVAGWGRS